MLEERGMSQAELAERTGRPKKTINEIIQGKVAITPDTALQFERVLGTPARFWLTREQHYREFLARQNDEERLAPHVAWLDRVPWKEMIKRGWIQQYNEPLDQLREVLRFFGIASPDQWSAVTASYRQSHVFATHEIAVSAWLRQGEVLAQHIDCAPFNADRFREVLHAVRALTCEEPAVFLEQLPTLCAPAGVAVVILPELGQTRIYGAARWLSSTKALIQLSLRYKRDDQFWFSFFHEAAHLVLHGKREAYLDTEDHEQTKREEEANRFAADFLIPRDALHAYLRRRKGVFSIAEVKAFAVQIGIAPGIVVGRLQHDKLVSPTHLNGLKRSLVKQP
ncbi:plasmid maintenance system antidote protein, XRE family [Oscillochloris trichoides DG-6]|uniref:Plasmid maintenance system antidote protein, XRE family n=1 Tax=Oscillochloris trichoides DG-6 TaxID=765420 RepID=E1IG78_9CHLR|nr:plasmid maintenance system antidote protein, XRE family [Oscillochloris trichoides DG-6]